MTQPRERIMDRVSRRKFLVTSGAVGAAGIAGCTGNGSGDGNGNGGNGNSGGNGGGNGNGNGNGNGDDGGNGSGGLSGEIVNTGSSTVFPITDYMAEQFMEEHPDVNVTVDSTGSGGGFENHFCPGNSDINGASRPIKDEEVENCQSNDVEPVEFQVAGDALTMAVNNDNDWVDCLTFEEMSMIWREDGVDNWSEVRDDFPDEPIEMYGPASTSGTYDWFLENVINFDDAGRNHTAEHEPTEEDNLIVQGISDNVGGIGYFGYAYYSENQDAVKAVEVRETEDDECGAPGLRAAAEGTYPMARPLFIYPNEEAMGREEVYAFLEFYLEEAGTDVIADDIGYVPSGSDLVEENLSKLEEYQ